MICQKCGALNNKNSWRCRSCFSLLRNEQQTETRSQAPQASFLQGQEPKLTRVDYFDQDSKKAADADAVITTQNRDRTRSEVDRQTEDGVIVDTTVKKPSGGGGNKWLIGGAATAALATVIILALVFFGRRDDSSVSETYATAEQLYQNQQFTAALPLYQQVMDKAPDGQLASLAKQRITIINEGLTALSKAPSATELHVEELLQKAKQAFEQDAYLTPTDNSVILFTDRILELDATNAEALALRAQVINYYEDKAESSLKRRRYNTAIRYYQNILKIVPGDSDYTAKLQFVMDKKDRR